MHNHPYSRLADKIGIASAVVCTVHCLLVPLLFALKYWWAANTAYTLPSWWGYLDFLFLFISFTAVYHAASHAATGGIKRMLWFFWGVLAVAIIFEEQLHALAYIASAGLVCTHFINIKKHRQHRRARAATQSAMVMSAN